MKSKITTIKLATLLLLVLTFSQAGAQKFAGYRGKYFMAGYSTNIGHNLFILNSESEKLKLHFRHGLHGEMLTNRFTSMGGEIDYLRSGIGTFSNREENGEYINIEKHFVTMSAGAYIKRYYGVRNGLIAPMGGYYKLKLFTERMFISNTDETGKTYNTNTYWSPGMGFAFGRSRVIKNSIRLDGALEFNALLGVFSPLLDFTTKDNRFVKRNMMSYYHLMGYSSTVKISASGLLF